MPSQTKRRKASTEQTPVCGCSTTNPATGAIPFQAILPAEMPLPVASKDAQYQELSKPTSQKPLITTSAGLSTGTTTPHIQIWLADSSVTCMPAVRLSPSLAGLHAGR
ncbi:MAG: hypothetical protein KIT83_01110 [Bryobacterales bacterium]|nr:hypothetical protein [Bryobacterales bacterium]